MFVISVISFPSPWWIVEGISNSFKTNFEKRYCDLICIVKIFPEINFMFIVQMYFFCIKWLFLYPIFWFFPCWFVWLGVFLILSPSMPFVILWLVYFIIIFFLRFIGIVTCFRISFLKIFTHFNKDGILTMIKSICVGARMLGLKLVLLFWQLCDPEEVTWDSILSL